MSLNKEEASWLLWALEFQIQKLSRGAWAKDEKRVESVREDLITIKRKLEEVYPGINVANSELATGKKAK